MVFFFSPNDFSPKLAYSKVLQSHRVLCTQIHTYKTQLVSKLLFLHQVSWIVGRKITKYKYRKNHICNYINMQSRERRLNRDTTVYLSSAPVRCHRFYRDEVLHSWKNWILCRIIRMILGRYLQNCRDRLVIAINQKPYPVCNLNIKDLV